MLLQLETHPLAIGVLLIATLILLYRHSLLCYGSRRVHLISILLYGLLVYCDPYRSTTLTVLPLLGTVLVVFFVEQLVISYAQYHSPFLTFNSGTVLAFLSIMHPGYLALLPLHLQKASQLKLNSPKHLSALLLGLLSMPVLFGLLVVPPDRTAVRTAMSGFFTRIASITFPPKESWLYLGGILILIVGVTMQSYFALQRSISRYRWMLALHLLLMWVMFALTLLYFGRNGYLTSALFFCCAASHYLFANSDSSRLLKITAILAVILCLAGGFITTSLHA